MDGLLRKSQYYQRQAVNMRTLAANESDLEARNVLFSLAEIYERLAIKYKDAAATGEDDVIRELKL